MTAPPVLSLAAPIQRIPGYLYGLRYPSLRIPLRLSATPRRPDMQHLDTLLRQALPPASQPGVTSAAADTPLPPGVNGQAALLQVMLNALNGLQRSAGVPVCQGGRLALHDSRQGRAIIVQPCLASGFTELIEATQWLLALCNCFVGGLDTRRLLAETGKRVQRLIASMPNGTNTPRFLRAAHAAEIPFVELPGRVYQYGQGRNARWLNSTLTDETSQISAIMARDKAMAATVLRRNGIPVPEHFLVRDSDSALQAARKLGYPVVVKPLALDGGIGVTADIANAQELRKAFDNARQHCDRLLIEKHIAGRDYRLTVFHDELVWAIERVPGGVVGDGQHSILSLLSERNATTPFKDRQLDLNDEALQLLQRAALNPDSIPAAGQFVRLRSIANIAAGGSSIAVFDQVHPDNRQLAVRAARALRLDLAGVDLIIPDISRSWLECGAVICEVNGQPQLGILTSAHLYPHILQCLLGGDGRIPVIVILGAEADNPLPEQLRQRLLASGRCPGYADASRILIGQETIASPPLNSFAAGQMLLLNPQVDCILLAIDDLAVFQFGLPVDRIDVLLVAGTHLSVKDGNDLRLFDKLLAQVANACSGKLLLPEGLRARSVSSAYQIEYIDLAAPELAERIIALLNHPQKLPRNPPDA